MITFNQYQEWCKTTDMSNNSIDPSWLYFVLGLAGETGEFVDKVKKVFRNDNGVIGNDKLEDLKKELGDVMWYVSMISTSLGISLDDVINANVDKLQKRVSAGNICGEGDNR